MTIIRKFGTNKNIIKTGNSAAITLNEDFLTYIGAKIGTKVRVMADEGKHGNFIAIFLYDEKLHGKDINNNGEENGYNSNKDPTTSV